MRIFSFKLARAADFDFLGSFFKMSPDFRVEDYEKAELFRKEVGQNVYYVSISDCKYWNDFIKDRVKAAVELPRIPNLDLYKRFYIGQSSAFTVNDEENEVIRDFPHHVIRYFHQEIEHWAFEDYDVISFEISNHIDLYEFYQLRKEAILDLVTFKTPITLIFFQGDKRLEMTT